VTSTSGKIVGVVRELAAAVGVPVSLVTGQAAAKPPAGVRVVELVELAGGVDQASRAPATWLAAAGAELAGIWPGASGSL
jgi:glycerate kinase